MHLTGDGQRHLAVALARRSGLEFGHALFQVCAAVATKVGCLGGRHRHATHEYASCGN
jgi:hypothetical protein